MGFFNCWCGWARNRHPSSDSHPTHFCFCFQPHTGAYCLTYLSLGGPFIMGDADAAELEGKIKACQAACARQGDTVRSLKASLKEGKADKVGLHVDVTCSLSLFGRPGVAGGGIAASPLQSKKRVGYLNAQTHRRMWMPPSWS